LGIQPARFWNLAGFRKTIHTRQILRNVNALIHFIQWILQRTLATTSSCQPIMAMTIRKYQATDRERIIELLRLNTPQYFSPKEETDLIQYLDWQAHNFFVLEVDGTVLGCGGFNLTKDGEMAYLSWGFVDPQSQGKGLGTALTRFRIQRIREIEGVKMIAVPTSQLTYPFYQRFGLKLIEVVKDFWDIGLDLYHLESYIQSVSIPLSE
jgi:[ribosomal protein S18]-alanine N-acetyltransferase